MLHSQGAGAIQIFNRTRALDFDVCGRAAPVAPVLHACYKHAGREMLDSYRTRSK